VVSQLSFIGFSGHSNEGNRETLHYPRVDEFFLPTLRCHSSSGRTDDQQDESVPPRGRIISENDSELQLLNFSNGEGEN
jgi:hypothetical protein